MRRMQLVELEDLPWFPGPIRDAGTDFLRLSISVGDAYAPAAPLLAAALRQSGAAQIVDLCAGGGGPWARLLPQLAALGLRPQVVLTDRYPNPAALAGLPAGVTYRQQPVDALAVPAELAGLRTLFSAFHHFPPAAGRALLADAIARRAPVAIFEATERSPRALALMLVAPVMALLLTPLIRPFRWSRLLFTYLIPIVPLFILWDGVVSCLRTYRPEELRALVADLPGAAGYGWQIGTASGRGPIPVSYLIGVPLATPPEELS